ncbi:MAG: hypothetical protein EBU90_09855 [Proteobacteria bacterium]|nr:hypothetical protein [Pseudomonadota bacterium]NBP14556.1 hypothetical protein [bacterium]
MITDKTNKLKVPDRLREDLLDFALTPNLSYWVKNPYGPNRRCCFLNRLNLPLTTDVKTFAEYCFKEVFNTTVAEEVEFGNFLGFNSEGAFVHRHRDRQGPNGEYHVRLNFLIQKPEGGGMPIINESPLIVNEGQCWINWASKNYHSSTPVEGCRPRIVLSLGSYIDLAIIKNFENVF